MQHVANNSIHWLVRNRRGQLVKLLTELESKHTTALFILHPQHSTAQATAVAPGACPQYLGLQLLHSVRLSALCVVSLPTDALPCLAVSAGALSLSGASGTSHGS